MLWVGSVAIGCEKDAVNSWYLKFLLEGFVAF